MYVVLQLCSIHYTNQTAAQYQPQHAFGSQKDMKSAIVKLQAQHIVSLTWSYNCKLSVMHGSHPYGSHHQCDSLSVV